MNKATNSLLTPETIKSIVFDLDGVLIDSRICMERSWNEINNKYKLGMKYIQAIKTIRTAHHFII